MNARVVLALAGASAAMAQTISFDPPVDWELSGSEPRRIVADDFNRDHNLDIAVTTSAGGEVSILLGDGQGGFPDTKTIHSGLSAWGLDSGDFNGDAYPDLAITAGLNGQTAVGIYLGLGNGTFVHHTTLGAGNFPLAVVAADYDEDGNTDLAVGNNVSGGFTVFLGSGDGYFGPGTAFGSGNTTDLCTADFDQDGHADLALSHYSGVGVYRGVGDGTFTWMASAGVATTTQAVAAGDLNDDGWPDVASGSLYGGEVFVRFNDTRGHFTVGPTLTPGSWLQDIVIGDLDRDGHLDIVAAHQDGHRVVVYLGAGGGVFLAGQAFATNLQPQAILAADLDEDGWDDLAVPCRMYGDTPFLSVLHQIPQGPVLDLVPDPLRAGGMATFTVSGATPNRLTWLAVSLLGPGRTDVPPLGITLELADPRQAAPPVRTDGAGAASWTLRVPGAGVGREVWFQACQENLVTNVAMTTIE